jgi:four helix bundle protein
MFAHEKLHAYQNAVAFVAWTQPIIETLPAKVSARDQLERSSTSVVLNLAEGNAKFSPGERARFFQSAHGSAVECAACLDVLVARGMMNSKTANVGKDLLETVVAPILGLLAKLGCRIAEDGDAR